MPTPPPDDRTMDLLEEALRHQEEGEPIDLVQLCGGDTEMVERVERLLELERDLGTSPVEEGEPFARQEFGEFCLLAPLGRGGMGEVFLAEQRSLKRLVALKVLLDGVCAEPTMRIRFRREAELTASIDHPAIVPIYGVGEEQERLYIAMKWIPGPTLSTANRDWSPIQVASVGAELARGLHEAHLAGVVHRDVKPSNVLLDDDQPILVDFGLAKSHGDVTLTREGTIAGTLTYLAPELLRRASASPDPRLDIYGLGATLYECLAGAPPFRATDSALLVREILEDAPSPLGLRGRDRDLETILLRALEKEPSDRFGSAMEFADDLDRYRRGEAIVSSRPGLSTRAARFVQRHRWASAAVAIALLVAIALGVRLGFEESRRRDRLQSRALDAVEAIDTTNLRRAQLLVADLEASDPVEVAVMRTRARLDRELALEDLLDAVLERPSTQSLAALEDNLTELADASLASVRPATERLARSMGLAALRRIDEARLILGEDTSLGGRAVTALLNEDATWRPDVEELKSSSAAELLIVAMAMRLLSSGGDEVTQVAEAAFAAATQRGATNASDDYRARYTLAVLAMEEEWRAGDRDAARRESLRRFNLLGYVDERRPALLRNIARLEFLVGDLGRGLAAQAELREKFPAVWSGGDVYWRMVGLRAAEKSDQLDRELADPENRKHALVLLFEFLDARMQVRGSPQEEQAALLDRANEALRLARSVSSTRFEEDLIEAYSIRADLGRALRQPAEADALLVRVLELLGRANDRESRRLAAHAGGYVLMGQGLPLEAIDLLEPAALANPNDKEVGLLWAEAVVGALKKGVTEARVDSVTGQSYPAFPLPGEWRGRAEQALDALQRFAEEGEVNVQRLAKCVRLAASLGLRATAGELAVVAMEETIRVNGEESELTRYFAQFAIAFGAHE